ncbi:MAG: tetratricopeptide repeat protein [Candidatus Euphemobacter frigidus]|nr:tetratricopeptide repeat protein [Candidatus Euphemobacter frigidus]MDP8275575.1 tetratricopeptide repeat protein [Candidatus Euphemobacter frigidus]
MFWIFKKEWFRLLLICLATVIAYGNAFQVPFVYDDLPQIVESAFIKNPAFLPKLFTADYFQLSPKRYRPITVAFYFPQYAFWRLNPWGYHLFKLLLHLANVILLYFYLRLLGVPSNIRVVSAALFALHPAQTETITCISFLDEPLMFFWFMLTLIAATRSLSGNSGGAWYSISLLFYILSLASKEPAIVLPVWLFLQCLVFSFPGRRRRYFFWCGYLLTTGIWVMIRFGIMNRVGPAPDAVSLTTGGLTLIVSSFLHYLRVAFLPVNLCLDYTLPLSGGVFTLPLLWLCLLVCLGTACILSGIFKSRFLLLGWGIFIISLLPFLNIIRTPHLVSDRYLYLPLAGFSLVGATLALKAGSRLRTGRWRWLFNISFIIVFLCWGTLIQKRNRVWRSPRRLWEDVLNYSPGSVTALSNLGSTYLEKGNFPRAEEYYRMALESFSTPSTTVAVYTNLAEALWEQGRKDEALRTLKNAIRIYPWFPRAFYTRGRFFYREGEVVPALKDYESALKLTPYNYLVYDYLAELFASQHYWEEAEDYARKVIDLNPDYALGYDHLGVIYANQGRGDEARAQWRRALKLDPNLQSVRNNLAAAE